MKIIKYLKTDTFSMFSQALYSSWCHYRPINALFDCGEGFSLFYKNNIFAVSNVFITHDHGDHTGGLAGLLAAWTSARGPKDKTIRIFYPYSNKFQKLKDFLSDISNANIQWYCILPGQEVSFGDNFKVIPFRTRHTHASSGYRVMERRFRLPERLRGLSGQELREIPANEKREEYWHPKFVYALDNCGADWNGCEGADILIQDCTFLRDEDREGMTHNTLSECLRISEELGVKKTFLTHVSPRYTFKDKKEVAKKLPPECVLV